MIVEIELFLTIMYLAYMRTLTFYILSMRSTIGYDIIIMSVVSCQSTGIAVLTIITIPAL